MFLQSFSVEFSAAAFRAFNQIWISGHRLFNLFLFYWLFLVKNDGLFRFSFCVLRQRLSFDGLDRFFNFLFLLFLSFFGDHDSFLSGSHRILLNRDSPFLFGWVIIQNQSELFGLSWSAKSDFLLGADCIVRFVGILAICIREKVPSFSGPLRSILPLRSRVWVLLRLLTVDGW